MPFTLTLGADYNITFYPNSIIGGGVKRAKVRGLLDYDTVKSLADVAHVHAMLYSQLASGTPRDASQLTYVKLQLTTGATMYIAQEWISGTPELATTQSLTVVFDGVAVGDISRLRALLTANGFNFTVQSS